MGGNDEIAGATGAGKGGASAGVEGPASTEPSASAHATRTTSASMSLAPLMGEVAASLEAGTVSAIDAIQGLVQAHAAELSGASEDAMPAHLLQDLITMISEDPLVTELLRSDAAPDDVTR